MDLGSYLAQAAMRHHQVGIWDCCIFPADWVVANGYPDPMADWRGTYASEAAADTRGGIEEAFLTGMERAGLSLAAEPLSGDVGLIEVAGQHAGAIWTGRRWAFVAPRGLAVASVAPEYVIGIWRVVYG
ncbi:hypothetical protein GTZ99_12490 [Novosphingobium sp. FSY-8]|uniref:DUF6950 domain-containing protein n=1 Tax=Novosphingobium ovatum TaxID=1908523 RepID=A0ABW9XFU8_9SPHN|nr:hypothetical protein [Novosphingobium ovatum]NBC37369.1 hypothetical protein [Novosphingobium ovatum]